MMVGRLGALGASDITTSIAQAIYQMEGSGPTTLATRNNNPGNLRSGVGQTGTSSGYAVFPDMATGWNALYHQIDLNISRGLTLYEFFAGKPGVYAGYAPSADSNNPVNYANFVAGQTGINPSVPLNQLGTSGGPAPGCDPIVDSNCYIPPADQLGSTFIGLDTSTLLMVAGVGLVLIWGISR